MPSFDVQSEIDLHELTNAVDQANRELETRFDFKGVKATYTREGFSVILEAPEQFQLKQMVEILKMREISLLEQDLHHQQFGRLTLLLEFPPLSP